MSHLSVEPRALIPRWWVAATVAVLVVAVVGWAALGVVSEGPTRPAALLSSSAAALALVSATAALLHRRRPRPAVDITGAPIVFETPALVLWPLLLAWMLLLATAAAWIVVVATDITSLDAPVFVFLIIVAALGSLPDLARLLSGRLHRWRLTVDDLGVTYRGYRTDVTLPWAELQGATLQHRDPRGLRLDRRGSGPDVVVPMAPFTDRAPEIIELVEHRIG
ncbi:MAG: hypothetical protein LH468_08465 [Nocardioides sp.]|nr:hypothetical protein [Nocardioides sp.]